MSASPGFHFWLLSGSRAHRDTCVPPITELWKFLGFKHCSLHSLSLSYLLLLSPSWTFSRESSTPLPITQTWTLCTHPHQHNHAHPISVCNTFSCVWQKVHLARLTLLKTPHLDTWNYIAHESLKMSFWKEKKKFHRIVFGFSLISSFLAGLAGRYVAKILTGLAAQQLPNF